MKLFIAALVLYACSLQAQNVTLGAAGTMGPLMAGTDPLHLAGKRLAMSVTLPVTEPNCNQGDGFYAIFVFVSGADCVSTGPITVNVRVAALRYKSTNASMVTVGHPAGTGTNTPLDIFWTDASGVRGGAVMIPPPGAWPDSIIQHWSALNSPQHFPFSAGSDCQNFSCFTYSLPDKTYGILGYAGNIFSVTH